MQFEPKNKFNNDQYYTPIELAKRLVDITFDIVGTDNIKEIIEPSAGTGSFSLQLPDCIAYDIDPKHESIIKQDYLQTNLEYKKGRLIIGNPPFGRVMNLALQFWNKSYPICDYIAFILPISQYKHSHKMFHFDLVYSEDLGMVNFGGKKINCCFNIYIRPKQGLNKQPDYSISGLKIEGYSIKRRENITPGYDYGIIGWGRNIGREVKAIGDHVSQWFFYIDRADKQELLQFIKGINWKQAYKFTTTFNLNKWQILKYIKDNYPKV